MTLTESAANALISEFGEEVVVTSMSDSEPHDEDNPIFIRDSDEEGDSETHRVRLYTNPSKETLEEYGFDDQTEAMMYSTDDIASEGDKVEYSITGKEWTVSRISTNQIGTGPYIFMYQLLSK